MTVGEAMASEHAEEWKAAMQEEIKTFMTWNCFDIVSRDEAKSLGGKLMKSRWIFKIKRESTGEIQRFKQDLLPAAILNDPVKTLPKLTPLISDTPVYEQFLPLQQPMISS